jgi:DNA-directed RNA polymerase specialized sigma24 family protein
VERNNPTEACPGPGSISRRIPPLGAGDRLAMQQLWERDFQPLVLLARGRMHPGRCRAAGPEDVALEAFLELCDQLARPGAAESFPRLQGREHLWKLLACFTVRAAFDHERKQARREQALRGESALGEEGLAAFAGHEPAPEFGAAVSEMLDQLQDDGLRAVAVWRMEGWTVQEIARRLDCSASTVERKLRAIRAIWQSRERGAP